MNVQNSTNKLNQSSGLADSSADHKTLSSSPESSEQPIFRSLSDVMMYNRIEELVCDENSVYDEAKLKELKELEPFMNEDQKFCFDYELKKKGQLDRRRQESEELVKQAEQMRIMSSEVLKESHQLAEEMERQMKEHARKQIEITDKLLENLDSMIESRKNMQDLFSHLNDAQESVHENKPKENEKLIVKKNVGNLNVQHGRKKQTRKIKEST